MIFKNIYFQYNAFDRIQKANKIISEANYLITNTTDQPESKFINRQNKLEEVFNKAITLLKNDQISQEAFRTLNEAYKTTREAIERERNTQNNYQR